MRGMRRLALVRRRFDGAGGAELYVQRLLGELLAAGHRPELVAESWLALPDGVPLHRVPVTGRRHRRPTSFVAGALAVCERQRFACVLSLERGLPADVYRAGDGLHRTWIANCRRWGSWWRRAGIGRGGFHRWLVSADAASLDATRTGHIIVNSDMVRREILAQHAFPADRLHLVRNGIEVDRFAAGDREGTRREQRAGGDTCVVLFAGSGWERKGLRWLLRAFRQLPATKYELWIVGRGRMPPRRPANVRFLGAVDRSRMPDLYAAADVFALPTLYDPCANACLEALAAGLPVITTRQNGAAELLVEGVNGSVLEEPAAVPTLAAEIERWARSRPARPVPVFHDLSLHRNLQETVAVLERARLEAASRSRGPGDGAGEAPAAPAGAALHVAHR